MADALKLVEKENIKSDGNGKENTYMDAKKEDKLENKKPTELPSWVPSQSELLKRSIL